MSALEPGDRVCTRHSDDTGEVLALWDQGNGLTWWRVRWDSGLEAVVDQRLLLLDRPGPRENITTTTGKAHR